MNYTKIPLNSPLFDGLSAKDAEKILICTGAVRKNYYKSEIIIHAGSRAVCAGVVLLGRAEAAEETVDGEKHIIAHHEIGDLFGEILMSAGNEQSPVTVYAAERCEILIIDSRILTVCPNACPCHTQLITNLLKMTARKYWRLFEKVRYLSMHSLRGKILAFLSDIREKNSTESSKIFEIQFTREGMASYLNVNRSALSRELSAMKRDGIIEYHKNKFELL